MLSFLPGPLLAVINLFFISLWLGLWGGLIFLGGLLKLLPISPWRKLINLFLHGFYQAWTLCMHGTLALTNCIEWQIELPAELDTKHWYLLISNHLSWLDIVVLTSQLHGRIPIGKFFLKQELIWVPFLGIGAWGLDMPFMKRYSKAFLAKYPHLKGKDIDATRAACAHFRHSPTTVINFVEGTRFTAEKQQHQQAPYQHLLAPKAGGIAFALNAMKFDAILNTTLCYPDNREPAMPAALKGELKRVVLKIEAIAVTDELIGDYFDDAAFRHQFQQQLNGWWQAKDDQLSELLAGGNTGATITDSVTPCK
ncbi:acyltransferase [Corallincola luteus]|uniref:Acyltransferase n=1 Tax=Corallincola luteus TaxID=1775177 RepID=A0ABY2AIY3_9GAMM|nr:acyltransferase [Corallincola luteus]TCI02682.1 acyltransferase [Corallincola luteus]